MAGSGLHFATRFPERVEALSLIAASGLTPQKRSFIFIALPLVMLGDWGLTRINELSAAVSSFLRRRGHSARDKEPKTAALARELNPRATGAS